MQMITPALQIILHVASLIVQEERDEREAGLEMEARYNAFIEALKTEQETMVTYFDRVFGERENALRHLYDVMDKATAAGDNKQLGDSGPRNSRHNQDQPPIGVRRVPKGLGGPTEDDRTLISRPKRPAPTCDEPAGEIQLNSSRARQRQRA